jgi:hypothetical protein
MGIEPTFSAWEADVLPLNYTRNFSDIFAWHPCRNFSGIRNTGLAVHWLGARREIHPLDEFLFPARLPRF